MEVVSVFTGEASGSNKGLECSAANVLRLKIASHGYDMMELKSEATSGPGKFKVAVKGGIFGVNRIFFQKEYPDDKSKDGEEGYPYYSKKLDLKPGVRFLVGVVPFKLQPNVTLKIDGAVDYKDTISANGRVQSFTFQPIRATAIVGLDFDVGVEVIKATLRGEVRAVRLSANINGKYFKKSDCTGGGSYRIFGTLDGPEGKLSFLAKFAIGKGKYEVDKELWKLPDATKADENKLTFVLKEGEFDFSNMYNFRTEIVSVQNGAFYKIENDSISATMQSVREDFVGQVFEESLPICVDFDGVNASFELDGIIHNITGSGDIRQISAFDKTPKEVVQSGGWATYYGVWTLIGKGTYNVKSGEIRLTYDDVFDLSWNLSGAVSTSRVKETVVGKLKPIP
jgi:hypothetical protein